MDSAVHVPDEIFHAGDLCIDVGRHRVTRDGVEIPLPKLSFELLLALVRAYPRMLTTDDLLESIWTPAVVNPETVAQRVKLLRQALGDDPRALRYVVGVRGQGYRMDVPVTRAQRDLAQESAATPSETPTATAASAPQIATSARRRWFNRRSVAALAVLLIMGSALFWGLTHGKHSAVREAQAGVSLAILPFVDMSPQHDQQYFSDGLAEELINRLAQVPELRVVGRTSSFAFRGRNDDLRKIGALLNANHVLEGSVRKSDNRVRITVQLIDSADGSYVWSQSYERTLDDVFGVQEEIGRAVARELQLKFERGAPNQGGTRNFAAFDEFLTARALLNSNDIPNAGPAVSHLEHAVALDASYLEAWIWLIDGYTRMATSDAEHRADITARQQQAIGRVSELAPASIYAAIANSYGALSSGRLEDAGRLLESTLDAPPGMRTRVRMRYGQFLLSVGNGSAAVDQLTQSRAADPLDVFLRLQLALALQVTGQLDRAEIETTQIQELPGGNSALLRGDRIARALGRGDRRALEAALAGNDNGTILPSGLQTRLLENLDSPRVALEQLRPVLSDPRTRSDLFALTSAMQWAAFLGDPELALQAARQAAKLGVSFETWSWTIWRPVMKDVRRRPEFKTLVQEMGLVDYWRATGNWGEFCKPVGSGDFECH